MGRHVTITLKCIGMPFNAFMQCNLIGVLTFQRTGQLFHGIQYLLLVNWGGGGGGKGVLLNHMIHVRSAHS